MKAIKLGIIGLGYIGQTHLRNCLRIPGVEVSAVADVAESALKKAKKVGAQRVSKNYEDLIKDPQIDAVVISVPTHLHVKCAIQAAESGKDILLEKPMAKNVEEAKEILRVAQRNSVRLMMSYPLRFNKKLSSVKSKMESGLIGEVENAQATFVSSGPFFHRAEGHTPVPVPDWWWNKELTGGGVLMDLGSHMINLLRLYFGEITDIRSVLGYRFNLDFEDSAICLAKFDSGTRVAMAVGWFSQEYMIKIDFLGTVKNVSVQHSPSKSLPTVAKMLATGKSEFQQPHFYEMQHFINCLINDVSPSPSGQDGLKDLEAIHRAYENHISLL